MTFSSSIILYSNLMACRGRGKRLCGKGRFVKSMDELLDQTEWASIFGDFTGFCAHASSDTCYRSAALIPMRPAHPTSSHGRLARQQRCRVVTRRINFRGFYRVRRMVQPPVLSLHLSPKFVFITVSLSHSRPSVRLSLSVAHPSSLVFHSSPTRHVLRHVCHPKRVILVAATRPRDVGLTKSILGF